MKKKFFILFTPIFSINFLFILMGGCFSKRPNYCIYSYNASLTVIDNADSIPHAPGSGGVLANALILKIIINDSSHLCVHNCVQFHANMAYASIATKGLTIDSFHLTSNHDFDVSHPAGHDLKDLFKSVDTPKIKNIYNGENTLYLFNVPSDTGTHLFTFKLFASDSTKNITVTSAPVKLLL